MHLRHFLVACGFRLEISRGVRLVLLLSVFCGTRGLLVSKSYLGHARLVDNMCSCTGGNCLGFPVLGGILRAASPFNSTAKRSGIADRRESLNYCRYCTCGRF